MRLRVLVTVLLLAITGCYVDERGAGQVKDAEPYDEEEVGSVFAEFELRQGNSKIKIAGKIDTTLGENGNIKELKEFHFKDLNPNKSDAPVEAVSLSKLGYGARGVIYRGSTDGGQEYWFHLKDKQLHLDIRTPDGSYYELQKSKIITADEWNELTQAKPSPAPTPEMSGKEVADILRTACGMADGDPNALLRRPRGRGPNTESFTREVNSSCSYEVHIGDNWKDLPAFAKYVQKTGMRCTMAANGYLQFRFPKSNNSLTLSCATERVDIEVKDDGSLEIKTTDKDGSVETMKVDSKGKFDGYSYPENGDPFRVAQ